MANAKGQVDHPLVPELEAQIASCEREALTVEAVASHFMADIWSVDPSDVVVSLGDTSLIAIGFGTMASRSTVTLSAAIHGASERLRAKVFAIAGNMLECAPADLLNAPGTKLPPRRRLH